MSDVYSLDYALRDSEQRHHILAELEDIRREFQLSGKKILELGCGFGHNLALFASDNQVRGIESNPEIAAKTAARGIETLNHDLDAGLPDPDESWDVVICLDVLEHLLRLLECAREISRVLKPGGIAILNVPNHFDLKGRFRILFGSDLDVHRFFPDSHEWDNPHIRFFTYRGFRNMLMIAGLGIVDDRSTHFPSIPLVSKYRFIQGLVRHIARMAPSLFTGGFFVLAQNNRAS